MSLKRCRRRRHFKNRVTLVPGTEARNRDVMFRRVPVQRRLVDQDVVDASRRRRRRRRRVVFWRRKFVFGLFSSARFPGSDWLDDLHSQTFNKTFFYSFLSFFLSFFLSSFLSSFLSQKIFFLSQKLQRGNHNFFLNQLVPTEIISNYLSKGVGVIKLFLRKNKLVRLSLTNFSLGGLIFASKDMLDTTCACIHNGMLMVVPLNIRLEGVYPKEAPFRCSTLW